MVKQPGLNHPAGPIATKRPIIVQPIQFVTNTGIPLVSQPGVLHPASTKKPCVVAPIEPFRPYPAQGANYYGHQ